MEFVPGRELNAAFYAEVVEPLLAGWAHSAGRLGWGSDVLGFDTERSTDHGWGPQLVVFVEGSAVEEVQAVIDQGLPESFRGWPVRYGWDETPVTHHVIVATLGPWLVDHLGVDAQQPLTRTQWLLTPQQKLLELSAGAVYRDDGGALGRVRAAVSWYPDDVWRWLLAAQWSRIAQVEAFVGRTAEVGDDLGSRLVAAGIARDLMHLWFLFARQYRPYPKWLGSAFARLPQSRPLQEALDRLIAAGSYPEREAALVDALGIVAERQNQLGLVEPVDPSVRRFHSRPHRVLRADRFSDACLAGLDPELRLLPLVGAIDQVTDSADLLTEAGLPQRLTALYDTDI